MSDVRVLASTGAEMTPRYCVTGMRAFCERNGLDFREFVQIGLPVSVLEKFDDEMVRNLIAAQLAKEAK